jgi:hypothetical protein
MKKMVDVNEATSEWGELWPARFIETRLKRRDSMTSDNQGAEFKSSTASKFLTLQNEFQPS